jgi:glycosyltransferase involved in cell wall biosynthesis
MSAGLIPVATDIGDARLIIGDAGLVVNPGRAAEMTAAITKLAVLDPAERQRRGLLARRRIEENFAMQRWVQAYAGLYHAGPP